MSGPVTYSSSGASASSASAGASLLVLSLWGDSNSAGVNGAAADGGMGPREGLQRTLHQSGVRFRMVGLRGWGAPNGTGNTWGKHHNIDDFHDAPKIVMSDWRNDGHGGRTLSFSTVVTSINTGTGVITSPGHQLSNGAPVYHTVSEGGTLPTVSVVQPVYFAANCNVGAGTYQLAQYDGGTTLSISDAGSGTITSNQGLAELVPGIFSTYDVVPTDVIAAGGINDMTALIALSTPSPLAVMQARAIAYFNAIDVAAPSARKYAATVAPPAPTLTNYAGVEALRQQYNAWLLTYVPTRGGRWRAVDAAAAVSTAHVTSDTLHLFRAGYDAYGVALAMAVVAASGAGADAERYPIPVFRVASQACLHLSAASHAANIPAQASTNPGGDPFFFGVRYFPYNPLTTSGAIIQCENPVGNGLAILYSLTNLNFFWRGVQITTSSGYNAVLSRFRWHDIFGFCDPIRHEAALFLNGQLVQCVYGLGTAITSSTGWYVGGAGLTSAIGLYRRFIFGHSASLNINDAARMAARYHANEDPPFTTAKYNLSEGSGTSIAGTLAGATAGTLTGGPTWIASGLYRDPGDQGYIAPRWDMRPSAITGAYTAARGECVPYDTTAGAIALAFPSPVGLGGQSIAVVETAGSTNNLTITPSAGLIVGGATLVLNTARTFRAFTSDNANWQPAS